MDQQQQAQQIGAMMAGMGAVFLLVGLVVFAFFIFLLWRIFTKAGMSGALSLLVIVPLVGPLVCLCILAFGQWKVVPAPQAYATGYPPQPPMVGGGYPPQQQFPPSNYPPSNYPPQS